MNGKSQEMCHLELHLSLLYRTLFNKTVRPKYHIRSAIRTSNVQNEYVPNQFVS